MAEPFLGEIMLFAGNFAPRGFALCNGQILAINQNQALFALLGTTYGGNGVQTFALPNLQSCVGISYGSGPGLSSYVQGENIGSVNTQLTIANLPAHSHVLMAAAATEGTTRSPATNAALANVGRNHSIYDGGPGGVAMSGAAIGSAGAGSPFSTLQPFLSVTFVIALQGIFPSRN
jgi:microcystin-dependent protein